MTQINNMNPEVMGWSIPSLSDVGRLLASPVRGGTHTIMETGRGVVNLDPGRILLSPIKGAGKTVAEAGRGAGFDVNTKSAAQIANERKQNIRNHVAKISGSNYAATLSYLNAAMQNFQALSASHKIEMQPVYYSGIEKARSAYIQNADTLIRLYKSFLTSNSPEAVTGAIQSYTLDMQSLMDSKHSTTNTKEIQNKDNELRGLLTSLQNYGENISSRQINLIEEQTRQQGLIIDYETGNGGSKSSGLAKFLIPAALGIGAVMLFKG